MQDMQSRSAFELSAEMDLPNVLTPCAVCLNGPFMCILQLGDHHYHSVTTPKICVFLSPEHATSNRQQPPATAEAPVERGLYEWLSQSTEVRAARRLCVLCSALSSALSALHTPFLKTRKGCFFKLLGTSSKNAPSSDARSH